ncbi:MAG: lytic transglycosylase [Paracoccaceae bacterium]
MNLSGLRLSGLRLLVLLICQVGLLHVGTLASAQDSVRPKARTNEPVATRWTHQPGHGVWEQAAISALKTHASGLVEMVPGDIRTWCPAYPDADDQARRAFWVGFLSALAKFESTYRETAIGGGGRWHGLLQILPGTARSYGCEARSGAALRNGGANLSCALRIMAVTVRRDGVVHGRGSSWQGVSADWGPMRSQSKRTDIANWTRSMPACQSKRSLRPKARP